MQSQRDLASKSLHPKHAQVVESGWHTARVSTLNGESQGQTVPVADLTPYRILLYSHDTFGQGNIRRTLLLTQDLTSQDPKAAILVVTGSPMIQAFRVPEGVYYIKLPCQYRVEAERYEPRFLFDCSEEMKRTRRAILEKSVLGFALDLMIVDKRPAGVDGELLETLGALQERPGRTRLVLGLRDILVGRQGDQQKHDDRAVAIANRYFDAILVHSDPAFARLEESFHACSKLTTPIHYTGYVSPVRGAKPESNGEVVASSRIPCTSTGHVLNTCRRTRYNHVSKV